MHLAIQSLYIMNDLLVYKYSKLHIHILLVVLFLVIYWFVII